MCKELTGKNAVITGSNRGIGRTIVEKFAENGCNIWACARTQSEEFECDMNELSEKYNVSITTVYFDLMDEEDLKNGIKQIISEKKKIDILVNNAGIAFGGVLHMTSMKKLKEVFEVNYFAQINIIQMISKMMIREKSGSIINMASIGGIESEPGYLAYGSSKAAFIWATKMLSKELGRYGIRVNAVAPGLTKTEMGMYKSEEEIKKVIERTSLGRMAEKEEIANAVLYLASDKSAFVTGHILNIDGGRV